MNVAIVRLELNVRSSAVDRADHRLLNHDPIFSTLLAAIFDRCRRGRVQLDFKIAINSSVQGFHLEIRLGISRQGYVYVTVESCEGHWFVRRYFRQANFYLTILCMRYDDANNVCQCDATIQIVGFDLALNSFGADFAL